MSGKIVVYCGDCGKRYGDCVCKEGDGSDDENGLYQSDEKISGKTMEQVRQHLRKIGFYRPTEQNP